MRRGGGYQAYINEKFTFFIKHFNFFYINRMFLFITNRLWYNNIDNIDNITF